MFYNFDANTLPHINRVYYATRDTAWTMAEPDNILIYILEGQCVFELDGNIYNAHKGSAVFIPANTNYFRRPYQNTSCTFLYIHFTVNTEIRCIDHSEAFAVVEKLKNHCNDIILEQINAYNDKQFLIHNNISLDPDDETVRNCIDTLIRHTKRQYMESHLVISILLWRIFSIIMSTSINLIINTNINFSTGIPKEIKNIVFYIKNNYNLQITIEDLCRHSMLSKQQLIRAFKKYLHTTPMAYIIDYRLCAAKALLTAVSDLSIKEIANEVGFIDQHYFCRIFKNKIGYTPSEYKQSNKPSSSMTGAKFL